jgi:LysM repeat protein
MPEFRRVRALAVGTAIALLIGVFSVDYTVERGDTLGGIARDHEVSITDLVEANEITNPNLIYPGQVLVIPGEAGEDGDEGGDGEDAQPNITHVVERGDTLARIASTYGASVSILVETNEISNPNLIRVGQNILIPGSASSGGADSSDSSNDESSSDDSSSSSTGRSGRYHIVKSGEKLETIAAQYSGVSADQIAQANGILNGTIYRGTRLFLDGPAFQATGTEGEIAYRIQSGDRLADIAAEHGTSASTLAEINNISNPNLIRSGQTLMIPSGASWVCPIQDASFFNDWGFPRGGGVRFHEGNDLFTTHGAPVYAPVSGMVEFKTGSIGGMQFNLEGDDGVMYLGSHMSGFGKSGAVNAGDVVGYVGNTGNALGTRPHLHFGMYLTGDVVVNPYPTLLAHGCK